MGNKRIPREVISQIRTAMVMQFPNCFSAKGQPKKPLKIRIDRDLFEQGRSAYPGLSRALIRAFLADYSGGANYHRCMVAGAARVDLNGGPAGAVTDVDASYHARLLDKINGGDQIRASKIASLKTKLENLREMAREHEISNGRYFTSLAKQRDDDAISAVQAELKALEQAA